ncbi:nuclease-related domain-containing protein [Lentibacillus sp. Marseille-P4043]|uniref:nuclease-related domain-containing protein n=1 Tax=Lentibacillus sp. Marseille-P4043 TaxID=2040293 RepID=UPI000D0B4A17|nr:nuclease-related domain-containing protein [Lentibacillus sp. Marseille-P4043]
MIIPLDKSDYIPQLKALDQRTATHHPEKQLIQTQLIKELAGARGQSALTFPLRFLHDEDYILRNPRIDDENECFEIDNLILKRNYILLVEVKNWYGTLYFDGEKQVVRKGDDGIEEGLPNPIPQVKLQQHRLQKWLRQFDLPQIPFLYFAVISFPSTIIKSMHTDQSVPEEVFHSNLLPLKIEKLNQQYSKNILSGNMLKTIAAQICNAHKVKKVHVLDKFHVSENELINGVFCQKCYANPMNWKYGTWHCPVCDHVSKNAHMQALDEYSLIINNEITNREARAFLRIDSPDVTKRLLSGSYPPIGKTGYRRYKLR